MYSIVSFCVWLFLLVGMFFSIVSTILFGLFLIKLLILKMLEKGGK